jgi:hypothetical protein
MVPFAVPLLSGKRETGERYVLGLVAALLLGSLPAWPQANPDDGPTITLGIGIKLPAGGTWPVAVGADHAIFYVPAVGNGEMLGVLVVPKGALWAFASFPACTEIQLRSQ